MDLFNQSVHHSSTFLSLENLRDKLENWHTTNQERDIWNILFEIE